MKRGKPLARKTPLRAHAPMRKRSRKSSPVRQSAKGEACTLNFPGCTGDRETVVLCHVRQFGGGGMGLKPSDAESCYGCAHCHGVLDGRIPWVANPPPDFDYWKAIAFAVIRTHRILRARGLMVLKGEEAA